MKNGRSAFPESIPIDTIDSIPLNTADMLYILPLHTCTVKPVLVATSNKQATCIKQTSVQFPKRANTLKCTCIKQAPVLSKHILIVP